MKHTLIFCSMALAGMMSMSMTSCSNDPDFGEPLSSVVLIHDLNLNVGSTLPLFVGSQFKVTATITNDSVTAPHVEWTSTKPDVATVVTGGENGLEGTIEAKAVGETTIQIADPVEERTIKTFNVKVMPKATAAVLKSNITVYEKASKSALESVVLTPSDAYNVFDWSSSDESVLTVDADGTLHGIKPGVATLTAKTKDGSNITMTSTVTVKKLVPVEKIALSELGFDMMVGETEQAPAVITPSDLTPDLLTWESSNTGVATVDGNGKITAVGAGTATIKATDKVTGSNLSDELTVTVAENGVISANMANLDADSFKALGWAIGNSANYKFDGQGLVVEPTQTSGNRRADFVMYSGSNQFTANAGTYRYFVVAMTPFGKGSIKLDTSKGDFGAQPTGWLEGGKSEVAYWDLQLKFSATATEKTNFQFKMADISTPPYGYTLYWLHTFKTLEDAKAYVNAHYKK